MKESIAGTPIFIELSREKKEPVQGLFLALDLAGELVWNYAQAPVYSGVLSNPEPIRT